MTEAGQLRIPIDAAIRAGLGIRSINDEAG
jgi:hypothetical protein